MKKRELKTVSNWEEFFGVHHGLNLKGLRRKDKVIRVPEELVELIEQEIMDRIAENPNSAKMGFNALVIASLCDSLQIRQREDGTFYKMRGTEIVANYLSKK